MKKFPRLAVPQILIVMHLCFALAWKAYGIDNDVGTKQLVAEPYESLSLGELEQFKDNIEMRLGTLAHYSMQSGVGSIGYRSSSHDDSNTREWLNIKLDNTTTIDEIVLVPTIWRSSDHGFIADAFPKAFEVKIGVSGDANGTVVATYGEEHQILPRIAPLVIDCDGIKGDWVRIDISELSARKFDAGYTLQLSEVLVFSGDRNVALKASVEVSSSERSGVGGWHENNLVDGFLPYLMDASDGDSSLAFVSTRAIRSTPWIIIDLQKTYLVDQINIHCVEQSDTVPQAFPGDFGIPEQLLIEGSEYEDFSNSHVIVDFQAVQSADIGPILTFSTGSHAQSRYIRLSAIKPYELIGYDPQGNPIKVKRIGFAEIEVLSDGKNVALNKPLQANFDSTSSDRSIDSVTDGFNLYGSILGTREWMRQLNDRHELELLHERVNERLDLLYDRQKNNMNRLLWVIAFLLFGGVILFISDRHLKQVAIFQTRDRIAADLHDELGANIHALALLGEMADAARDKPEQQHELVGRICELVNRTSRGIRYCTSVLETPGLYDDLPGAIRRNTKRLLADLEHEIHIDGEAYLKDLKHSKRIDLVLFYKESLVNIIQHSGATRVKVDLIVSDKELVFKVADNGIGLPHEFKDVPASLRRRARLLRAKVSVAPSEWQGTEIVLTIKL